MKNTHPHAHSRSTSPAPRRRDSTVKEASGGVLPTITSALRGSLYTLSALLPLSALAALAAYSTRDPDAWTTPLSLCALALAALLGGWMTYRIGRRRGCHSRLAGGLLCGGMTLMLLFALSLCLPDSFGRQWPASLVWGLRAGVPAFCTLGALMAGYAPRKRKKRRR